MKTTEKHPEAWEEHQRVRRLAWLRLTPLQRLRWLDDAKTFQIKAAAAARARRLGHVRESGGG